MSDKRYLGNIITQNPTAPDGDFANSAAKGVWSLEEQLAYQKAGLWPVPGKFLNVEDVFSTYLYTGNSTARSITNGIDLAGEGGLTWIKSRSSTREHSLYDTERGVEKLLKTNSTGAEQNTSGGLTSFNSNGFSLGTYADVNGTSYGDFASWTFRKASKFFDVVTYTGDGTGTQNISHNLGAVPGCIIVKRTDTTEDWWVYHRGISTPNDQVKLNTTDAAGIGSFRFGVNGSSLDINSSTFTVGGGSFGALDLNQNNGTYVAYLFAHNDGDGGFGADGDADIIKCGSYTGTGSAGNNVDLGFEPQWLMIKRTNSTGNWQIADVMRGMPNNGGAGAYQRLSANLSNAEVNGQEGPIPTSTGFVLNSTSFDTNGSGGTYIYIAIRRGTAVPESATEVFGVSYAQNVNAVPFPVDFMLNKIYGGGNTYARDRLRGGTKYLLTETTNADLTGSDIGFDDMTGNTAVWGTGFINYNWKRAPSYMDVVAYTGNSTAGRTVSHNLGVAPEMIWVKARNQTYDWAVHHKDVGFSNILYLNLNLAEASNPYFISASSDTDFTTGYSGTTSAYSNQSGTNYIAYLFATLAGISKVGSVTHSGTTNVDCGFSSGARFILLKRTDASGDWYVWDSERGIVSGNDPYFLLNTTAAQVTNTDYIDPLSSGFTITSSFTAGDYIFYAIA